MPQQFTTGQSKWARGHLHQIDAIPSGDDKLSDAISTYASSVNSDRSSRHWIRCFPLGTNICVPNGGFKSIEDIEVGDTVVGPNGNTKVSAKFEYDFDIGLFPRTQLWNAPRLTLLSKMLLTPPTFIITVMMAVVELLFATTEYVCDNSNPIKRIFVKSIVKEDQDV